MTNLTQNNALNCYFVNFEKVSAPRVEGTLTQPQKTQHLWVKERVVYRPMKILARAKIENTQAAMVACHGFTRL